MTSLCLPYLLVDGYVRSCSRAQVQLFNQQELTWLDMVVLFLLSHFVWALSLVVLFSGRGYWQKLIESICWAHYKLHVVPILLPRALSITSGRAVGVVHYLAGGIGSSWSFLITAAIVEDNVKPTDPTL